MQTDETHRDAAAHQATPDGAISEGTRISRRQAMARLSVVATLGAAAWVVPEILTASPSGGATLSVPEGLTGPSVAAAGEGPSAAAAVDGPSAVTTATDKVNSSGAQTSLGSLAYSGVNLQRDAEIGAALIAGGWAMEHWASRTPDRRPTE